MSTVRRTIISNPERTSIETWTKITGIVCGEDKNAKKEFNSVSNVICSLLPEELMKANPMIVKGAGSQLRVYCLYGEDAMTGEDANEDDLSWEITAKSWTAYLPCSQTELAWYEKALSNASDNFKVYDFEKGIETEEATTKQNNSSTFKIDKEAFKNL